MIKAIIFDLSGVLFTNGTKQFVKFIANEFNVDKEWVHPIEEESYYYNLT